MTKTINKLPAFKSIQEEAEFWDTHSFADYWDGWKPVKVRFAKNLSDALTVRFDPEDVPKIRELAYKKGIGPISLVRMWVREHIHAWNVRLDKQWSSDRR